MERTVVRRGALDKAWDTILAEFPVELWPHVRRFVEARREFSQARGDLTLAKIPYKMEWYQLDQKLAAL